MGYQRIRKSKPDRFTRIVKEAAIRRELKRKKRVFPDMIANGVLSREICSREIRVLEAILLDYAPTPKDT